MTKNKDNKPYSYPKEATPEQVGEMAKKFEEMRQMTGSAGRYDKPKPKKKVMEPIEIGPIVSVPRYEDYKKRRTAHTFEELMEEHPGSENLKHYTDENGLSQEFTQAKIREGDILKQLDKEMTNDRKNNERKNNETTTQGGDYD